MCRPSRSIVTSLPGVVRSRPIIVMSLSVCLSARITPKPRDQTSRNVSCMLHRLAVVVARGVAIGYVLPVLWMTSCFNGPIARHVFTVSDGSRQTYNSPQIRTKFCSMTKTGSKLTHCKMRTGAKSVVYDCLVLLVRDRSGDRLNVVGGTTTTCQWWSTTDCTTCD